MAPDEHMTPEQYKHLTTDLTFPSGLQLMIKPPSIARLMTLQQQGMAATTEESYVDFLAQVMLEVAKGFPDGFTLDDITDPRDWAYLEQYSLGFFEAMHFQGSASTPPPNGS